MNYEKSIDNLVKLNIDPNTYKKIVDTDLIKTLTDNILQDVDLPSNIIAKEASEEYLEDQSKYDNLEVLPKYIIKKNLEVTSEKELKEIEAYLISSLSINPVHVISKMVNKDGRYVKAYFYRKKFCYYKQIYDFYEVIPFTDEEMTFQLLSLNTIAAKSTAKSLFFFKVLVIIILIGLAVIYIASNV